MYWLIDRLKLITTQTSFGRVCIGVCRVVSCGVAVVEFGLQSTRCRMPWRNCAAWCGCCWQRWPMYQKRCSSRRRSTDWDDISGPLTSCALHHACRTAFIPNIIVSPFPHVLRPVAESVYNGSPTLRLRHSKYLRVLLYELLLPFAYI